MVDGFFETGAHIRSVPLSRESWSNFWRNDEKGRADEADEEWTTK